MKERTSSKIATVIIKKCWDCELKKALTVSMPITLPNAGENAALLVGDVEENLSALIFKYVIYKNTIIHTSKSNNSIASKIKLGLDSKAIIR